MGTGGAAASNAGCGADVGLANLLAARSLGDHFPESVRNEWLGIGAADGNVVNPSVRLT
jgi:hypothetical protein